MGVSVSQADSGWDSPVSSDCYLDNTLESPEKGILVGKLPPSDWFVGMSVGACSRLFIDVGRPNPLWVAPFPRLVVLRYKRKITKQEPQSQRVGKQIAAFHGYFLNSCSSSCPDLLEWWTVTWMQKPNKSFPPLSCLWPEYFITATERKLEHSVTCPNALIREINNGEKQREEI